MHMTITAPHEGYRRHRHKHRCLLVKLPRKRLPRLPNGLKPTPGGRGTAHSLITGTLLRNVGRRLRHNLTTRSTVFQVRVKLRNPPYNLLVVLVLFMVLSIWFGFCFYLSGSSSVYLVLVQLTFCFAGDVIAFEGRPLADDSVFLQAYHQSGDPEFKTLCVRVDVARVSPPPRPPYYARETHACLPYHATDSAVAASAAAVIHQVL